MVPAPLIGMGDDGRGQSQPDIINARPKNKACHKARPLFFLKLRSWQGSTGTNSRSRGENNNYKSRRGREAVQKKRGEIFRFRIMPQFVL
jgi:hypothetical protein